MAVSDLTSLLYGDQGSDPNAAPAAPQTPAPAPASSAVAQAVAPSGIGSDARYPVAPPLGWNPPPLAPQDRDAMIRTIAGEAGNQPPLGQAAVAHTILNRVALGGYSPTPGSIQSTVQAPVKPGSQYHQFSVWNPAGVRESSNITHSITPNDPTYQKIGAIVDKVYSGAIPDPTGGATHYYAPAAMPGGVAPSWAAQLAALNSTRIGDQVFVGGAGGPGRIFSTTPSIQTAANF